ncbi:MAG TPA: efflux RND transporter permease subunit [Alphaproteobacteria bacterium]|nr:efflux RND transporter permease subunit [Alphaproteobacteria bacterium]
MIKFKVHFSTWFDRKFNNLLNSYDRSVRKTLERPKGTLILLLLGILLSFGLIPFIGISYFPLTDSGFFIINIKAPTGTRVEVTAQEVKKVEDIVRRIAGNDVEMIVSNIGITPDFTAMYTSNTASHTAFTQVNLKGIRKDSTARTIARVRHELQQELPQLRTYFQSGGLVDAIVNQGVPAPIDIQVSGFDLQEIYKVSSLIASKISALGSVRDVFIPQDIDAPSLMLDIKREYASELGLNPQEIIHTIITSLTSNQMIAPNYWIDPKNGNDYFLTVQYPEGSVNTLQDLKSIPLRSPKRQNTVYLDSVANIKPFVSPTVITHYQLQRVIDIYVSPRGEDLGHISTQISHILKQIKAPPNVRIEMRGLVESMHASFKTFGIGLILAILLVYLVLVAQFKSFIDPFIILLAVLPGISGTILILFFTSTTFNIISLMGILMMIGITVSNSILIMEFTHRLFEEGLSLSAAVVNACKVRLRPILMTSFATIFGLLPMSLGLSEGSETYAPLARVIIGGLCVSVLVTIFLIPVACLVIYQRRSFMKSRGSEVNG